MEVIYQKREKMRNENRTFRFLIDIREFNKLEISQYLNISIPTVTKIVDKFLKDKLIIEIGTEQGKLGRKATRYRFNPDAYFSIGIKIEKDYLSMILTNLDGTILKRTTIHEEFGNEENFIFLIINELKKFLWEFDKKSSLKGIGIVLPGVVDPAKPFIKLGNSFAISTESLKEIEEEFEIPIYLGNEANAGALGEYLMNSHELADVKNMLFLSIDTEIGSGIIIDKVLYRGGKESKAGEIGHITVVPDGRECSCGFKGCLDQYCSNIALVKDFRDTFNYNFEEYDEIFQSEYIDTPKGKEIIGNYVKYLARGILPALLLLNPDKIVIGGKICNYKEYFEEPLKELLFKNNSFYDNPDILEFSTLADTAPLLGAAFLPLRSLYRTEKD